MNNPNTITTIIKLYLGIGDWGLGIAIPNTQSPIPMFLNFKILR